MSHGTFGAVWRYARQPRLVLLEPLHAEFALVPRIPTIRGESAPRIGIFHEMQRQRDKRGGSEQVVQVFHELHDPEETLARWRRQIDALRQLDLKS